MEDGKARYTSYLPKEIIEEIKTISEQTGLKYSRIIENAVRYYLSKVEEEPALLFIKKDE